MKKQVDKLEALKQKLAGLDLGGGGQGFWSPKEGKQTIRILPPVGDMEFFFQSVGRHFFPGNKYVMCPEFTSDGELECPVCEIVSQLYKGGKAEKQLAEQLGKRRSFWMNIIVRSSDGDEGPFIFTPGSMIFQPLVGLIYDPDYGEFFNAEAGHDITIDRKGKGLKTEYSVIPRPRKTPLSTDADKVEEWLAAAKDLSYVEVSEDPDEDKAIIGDKAVYVLPYNRIVDEFNLDSVDEMSAADYEASEEKSAAKAKPAARRPQLEVEETDDDEEPEEEDDDEEAVRTSIQNQRRRVAKRR